MMAELCDKCGEEYTGHSLVEIMVCLYSGAETKAGHPFGRKDAELIRDRVVGRLSGASPSRER